MKRERRTREELEEAWNMGPDEHALLSGKRGATRLGFAVLVRFFAREGRFPEPPEEIDVDAVAHVARQVGIPAAEYARYDRGGRTHEYHRAQVREAFGFRSATVEDADALADWLLGEVAPREYDPERLTEAAYARLRALKVEPPTPQRVERAARSALRRYDERFREQTLSRLPPRAIAELDALLLGPDARPTAPSGADVPGEASSGEAEEATLSRLRADPGRASLESAFAEVAKLARLRAVGLPDGLFEGVQPKVVRAYRKRAAAEPPSALRAHPAPVRYALLAALCHERLREVTDGLVDLLIRIVHKIGARAERKVERAMVRDFRRVHGKQGMLVRVAEASLARPDGTVREVVFPAVAEKTLAEVVREAKAQGAAFREQVQTRMRSSYVGHYRRLVPALLSALEFRSNNALYRPVLLAVALLRAHTGDGRRFFGDEEEVPIAGVVPPAWRDAVVREDGKGRTRIERAAYELCALESLREALRSKEVWVFGADRYRNPDEDLPQDFDERRASYYGLLDQPMKADRFVEDLRGRMEEALDALDRGYPRNPHLKIRERGKGRVRLSPLPKQPEPPNLDALRADVAGRWPMTGLLDILKEADLRLGFTDLLTTVASRQALPSDVLQKRLLLCLYGLGTNAGLKRVAAGDEGSAYSDLRYVRRRFVHKEQLRAAIGRVADGVFAARDRFIWGEATTACASDSKKFGAWDQNLMTEWHIRYGGRGVMIYWHVEKKSVCIYSQLKSASSSEVAAMIEGVLRHCTEMSVDKNYVDTHGQSEVAFAFSHLLGFRLLPRLKNIASQRLYRPKKGEPGRWPNLQPVLTRPIDWGLIRNQYDQMVRFASALKVGTAEAESILRRFTRSNLQHPTYRALSELGRAVKTVFLCEYLSSLELRQEVHEGLNTIESWNAANSFIFYGKGGEVASNRLEEQEVSVLSLHLLQLSLVYVNTLMIQEVLSGPSWSGRLTEEDLRGLTPLIFGHVNPYGRFELDMEERLPLRDAVRAP
ncbi:MAG: Tn3 family transposase [Actinomycetota bacterium]|nr:Tn3 family transposase [Actinomycetota bacterium]